MWTPVGQRDALLIALLLDHGLRCGELAGVQRSDLDLTACMLRFYREKVSKTQTHKLSIDTFRAALAYLGDRGDGMSTVLLGATKAGELIVKALTSSTRLYR